MLSGEDPLEPLELLHSLRISVVEAVLLSANFSQLESRFTMFDPLLDNEPKNFSISILEAPDNLHVQLGRVHLSVMNSRQENRG